MHPRCLALLLPACAAPAPATVADPLDSVNPFIATGGPGFRVGSATPAATVPFGMVKLGPDTSLDGVGIGPLHCGGYSYPDSHIEGFSHTHMHGVGVPALGNILFMPGFGIADAARGPDDWRLPFDHAIEEASPGYYAVTLDGRIQVELSATMHTGHHRYRWPEGTTDASVAIDLGYTAYGTNLGAAIEVDEASGAVSGFMTNDDAFGGHFPIYFWAEFDAPIVRSSVWREGEPLPGAPEESEGDEVGVVLHFDGAEVEARVGLSLIDVAAARANLDAELPDSQPIEDTEAQARAVWGEAFEGWSLAGAAEDDGVIFWTALYHLLQMPTQYSDADGRYVGFDGLVHQAEGWNYHSDLSLWDTYRTAHPAFNLFYPELGRDFSTSLLVMAEQGGAYPRWPVARTDGSSMVGQPADIALADAVVKGVLDWRHEDAWELARRQALGASVPYNARPGVPEIEDLGYMPSDVFGGSVAWQQEMSWADHAIALWAQAEGDAESAAYFAWRARQYRNLYDPEQAYFHGRLSSGEFESELNPLAWEDEFVEGNAWQYLWMAPWDHAELARILGGEELARARLTQFFEGAVAEGAIIGPGTYYWHGNEPDIHAPWLFTLWGSHADTVKWVEWVRTTQYHNDPDGLAGNDDAGTLSAWYLFAAAGFYPIAGTPTYILGEAPFPELEFPVENGTFRVARDGEGELVAIELNGIPWSSPTFDHSQLRGGGSLIFRYE